MKYVNSEGSFDAVVTQPPAGWIGESEEKQTPYVRIPVQITDDGPEKGAGAVWQGWLSNAAFDKTIARLVEVFGFNGDLAGLATGKQTFAGKPCNISVEAEDYNNKRRYKVKWLNAIGGAGGGKPLDKLKLNRLIQEFQQRSMSVAENISKNAVGAKSPSDFLPEPPEDSSVPF